MAWQRLFPGETEIGADLLARWAESHRRYHTLEHLAYMLRVVDEHGDLTDDAVAVRLATWFHDAVYDPTANDNEERSARLAMTALRRLDVPTARIEEVVRLIRLTAGHAVSDGDRNGGLLADADLAILADSAERYAAYARAVREEYAFVPQELFRAGRAAVLQHLLDLPALFRVVPERDAWTSRARANLRAEIDELSRTA